MMFFATSVLMFLTSQARMTDENGKLFEDVSSGLLTRSRLRDFAFNPHFGDGCLTPEQDQTLEDVITDIDNTLQTTIAALKLVEMFVGPQARANIEEAIQIIQTVQDQLDQNLQRIVDETCGTCKDITNAIDDMIKLIEDTLSKIEPDWPSSPIWQTVVDAINLILGLVKDICPSVASFNMLEHMYLLECFYKNIILIYMDYPLTLHVWAI